MKFKVAKIPPISSLESVRDKSDIDTKRCPTVSGTIGQTSCSHVPRCLSNSSFAWFAFVKQGRYLGAHASLRNRWENWSRELDRDGSWRFFSSKIRSTRVRSHNEHRLTWVPTWHHLHQLSDFRLTDSAVYLRSCFQISHGWRTSSIFVKRVDPPKEKQKRKNGKTLKNMYFQCISMYFFAKFL